MGALGLTSLAAAISSATALACWTPPPAPIDYALSCNEQADAYVAATLANPTFTFADNGGVYTTDPVAAQQESFVELIQPTNPIGVSGHANTSIGVLDLTGFLRLARCAGEGRKFWVCYANNPNSMNPYTWEEIETLFKGKDNVRVPVASTSQVTDTKVGTHYLTCNAGGQKPTGHFVSTGNGGEMATSDEAGAGLVKTNRLDWTEEVS
jgi:hypothetical protein